MPPKSEPPPPQRAWHGSIFPDCVFSAADFCFTSPGNDTGLMSPWVTCSETEQVVFHAKANSEESQKHSTKGLGLSSPDEKQDVVIENDLRVQAGPLKTERRDDTSGGHRLQYNEYIVYNTSEVKMRYLLKMKFS
ncbi:Poly [ADP-ribose] polymerase 2 [Mortierella alpina]|nr:Poly [ADP-ribose] polymerase 2 [Mortierella alpina]